jgi:hypothetical protein
MGLVVFVYMGGRGRGCGCVDLQKGGSCGYGC